MRGTSRLRLLLAVLVLAAVSLTLLDFSHAAGSPLSSLRRGVDRVLGPATRSAGSAAGSVGRALGDLPRLSNYQQDNKRLMRENDVLRTELRSSVGLRCEHARVQALLRLKDFAGLTLVPAHVVSLGSAPGFERTATIDVGSGDRIKPGQTVVTGLGLVGRTKLVGPSTSVVVLLDDAGFGVGAQPAGAPGFGVAKGDGAGRLAYQVAGQTPTIKRGDPLVTSGSGTFEPGIPVGSVLSIAPDASSLSRTAVVQPFVDTGSLDLVGVVTTGPRTAPRLPLGPVRPGTEPDTCGGRPTSVLAPPVPRRSPATPAAVPTRSAASPSAPSPSAPSPSVVRPR